MLPKERPCPIENKMILTDDNVDLSMSLAIPVGGIIINAVQLDQVISGIYLTNSSDYWTPSNLRAHGFTHLIYIDQHIQYNNNNNNNNNNDRNSNSNNNNNCNDNNNLTKSTRSDMRRCLDVIDLNFGEVSHLATVLPNCDKAVRFIEKALENGGLILVIDQNTDQKCLTIVIAYLMYKNNMNFNDAFEKVKNVFTNAELEKFFISQLYEYEPILEVQRTFSRGSSYSSEMRRSHLKRKKLCDDYDNNNSNSNISNHNYNNAIRYNNSNVSETSNNNNNNNSSTDYVMME